jgi:hypothetical protein
MEETHHALTVRHALRRVQDTEAGARSRTGNTRCGGTPSDQASGEFIGVLWAVGTASLRLTPPVRRDGLLWRPGAMTSTPGRPPELIRRPTTHPSGPLRRVGRLVLNGAPRRVADEVWPARRVLDHRQQREGAVATRDDIGHLASCQPSEACPLGQPTIKDCRARDLMAQLRPVRMDLGPIVSPVRTIRLASSPTWTANAGVALPTSCTPASQPSRRRPSGSPQGLPTSPDHQGAERAAPMPSSVTRSIW